MSYIDYQVSKNTLNYIETTLLEYKKKILKDLSKNFINKTFVELENEFLIKKKPVSFKSKQRTDIKFDKCMARIWVKNDGAKQCSRNKLEGHDYCKQHIDKLNYGRIDQNIKI